MSLFMFLIMGCSSQKSKMSSTRGEVIETKKGKSNQKALQKKRSEIMTKKHTQPEQANSTFYGHYHLDSERMKGTVSLLPCEEDADKAWFVLEAVGPKPGYHLAVIDSAVVRLKGQRFTYNDDDFPDCKLVGSLQGDSLKIEQHGSDHECGFGLNMYVNGWYIKDRK